MFLIRLFRLLTGYVLFSATGGFPERLINLCTAEGIPVWDIRPRKDVLYGKTPASCYKHMHRIARKSGMCIRLVRKIGVPIFMNHNRQRVGLCIGALVFVALTAFLSTRIWMFDVTGNTRTADYTVLSALNGLGIREGYRASKLDASSMERQLLSALPEVSWVALNVDGAVLHVEVREKNETDAPVDYTHPCHIVASKDGFLRTLETYEGKAMGELNTAVQKGQLLISGITDNSDGSVILHHAKGYVEAETDQTLCVRVSKTAVYPVVTGKKFRTSVHIFGLGLPLGALRPTVGATYFSYENRLTSKGKALPMSVRVYRNTFTGGENRLSPNYTKLLLLSDFSEQASNLFYPGRILSMETTLSENKENLTMEGSFHLLENIGTEQPILVDSEGTD